MAAPLNKNTKLIILSALEELIQIKQIPDITLADIATTAQISKGTLYYHYKSKSDILLDATDAFLDQQVIDLENWTTDKSKDTSISRFTRYVMERTILSTATRIYLTYEAINGNKDIADKLKQRYDTFAQLIGNKIDQRTGQNDGKFYAWIMLLLCDGISIQQRISNINFDKDDFMNQLITLFSTLEN